MKKKFLLVIFLTLVFVPFGLSAAKKSDLSESKSPSAKQVPQTLTMEQVQMLMQNASTGAPAGMPEFAQPMPSGQSTPQTLTMEQVQMLMQNASTGTPAGMPAFPQMPSEQVTPNMPLEKRVQINVNKLNSSVQMNEQTMAKNQLIKMGKDAVPYLHEHIQNDKRTWVRAQIAQILGKIGGESSIPVLEKTGQSQYSALNKNCIRAIGAIGGSKAEGSLIRLKEISANKELEADIDSAIKEAQEKVSK